jgi:hypothetical protein
MSSTYAGDPTNYPTSITIPDDGDARTAASVNAAFEGLADRTAWLADAAGGVFYKCSPDGSGTPLATYSDTHETWEAATVSTTPQFATDAALILAVTDCEVGDVLLIDATVAAMIDWPAGDPSRQVFVFLGVTDTGGNKYVPGGVAHIMRDGDDYTTVAVTYPVALSGRFVVTVAGTNTVKLGVQFDANTASWDCALGDGVTIFVRRLPA